MVVLNYPTFNCTWEGTQYGSTYDLANPCVGALAAALGGLQGLSTSPYGLVQIFTNLIFIGIFLVDANPIRLQRRDQGDQPCSHLPPSILELFH
jgi:hypothetical protein